MRAQEGGLVYRLAKVGTLAKAPKRISLKFPQKTPHRHVSLQASYKLHDPFANLLFHG